MRKKLTKGISMLVALVFCMTLIPAGILTASAATSFADTFDGYAGTRQNYSDTSVSVPSSYWPSGGWTSSGHRNPGAFMYAGTDSTWGTTVKLETANASTASTANNIALDSNAILNTAWNTITVSAVVRKYDNLNDSYIRIYRNKVEGTDSNNNLWTPLWLKKDGGIYYGKSHSEQTKIGEWKTNTWYRVTFTLDMTGKSSVPTSGYVGVTDLSDGSPVCESDEVTFAGMRDNTASGTPRVYIFHEGKQNQSASSYFEIGDFKAYEGAALAADKPSATVTPDPDPEPDPEPEPEDTIITDPAAVETANIKNVDFRNYTAEKGTNDADTAAKPGNINHSNLEKPGTWMYSAADDKFGRALVLETSSTNNLHASVQGTKDGVDVITYNVSFKKLDNVADSQIWIYREGKTSSDQNQYWRIINIDNGGNITFNDGTVIGKWEVGKWYTISITLDTKDKNSSTTSVIDAIVRDENDKLLYTKTWELAAGRAGNAALAGGGL